MSQGCGRVIFKSKGQGNNALINENMVWLGKMILAHNFFSFTQEKWKCHDVKKKQKSVKTQH